MKTIIKASSIALLTLACSHSMAASLAENIHTYSEAWKIQDSDIRLAVLKQVLADDIVYVDPNTILNGQIIKGPEQMNDLIQLFHENMVGWGLYPIGGSLVSNIDLYGNKEGVRHYRVEWDINALQGLPGQFHMMDGFDSGTGNSENKITSVTGFFGKLIGLCNAPAWAENTVYLSDDTVVLDNTTYQANWWTNNSPISDIAIANGEWDNLGICAPRLD